MRELEDNCKVNIRFMYLMDHQTLSYKTFGYFINEILQDKIENIFNDINHAFAHDFSHLYTTGTKKEMRKNSIEFFRIPFLLYLQNYIHVDISLRINFLRFGQALTRLVTVSSMCCHTSTSALSTSSSSRGFTSREWDISS